MSIIKNIQILLVDNTAPIRNVVKMLLQELGYNNLLQADDSVNALDIIKNKKIDLIMSDWDAQYIVEKEFLISLRKEERYKNLPIVIVSAEAKREQIMEAAEFDISGYLVMPLSGAVLQDKIVKIFKDRVG